MDETITGVIEEVFTKPFTDRKTGQQISLYSFRLVGNGTYYRTGRDPVPFGAGTGVKFIAKGQNVSAAGIEQVQAETAPAQQAAAKPAPAPSGGSRDGYWAEKERRDIEKDTRYQNVDIPRMTYSSCQDRAVNLVSAALAHDCLSFGNAAKGKKLDMLLDYVDQVTERFVSKTVASPDMFDSDGNFTGDNWSVGLTNEGDGELDD